MSAVDAFLPVYRALAALETRRNVERHPLLTGYPVPCPVSVGTLRAGDWAEQRARPPGGRGTAGSPAGRGRGARPRQELEACVAEVCARDAWLRDHPARVTWPGGQLRQRQSARGPPAGGPGGHAHADVTGGRPLPEAGAPYGSDLRLYAAEGIPTVQYGPGDISLAHGPREQVRLSEVVTVTRTLVLTALRAVGTA